MSSIACVYLFLLQLVNFYQSQASHKLIGNIDRILYGHSFLNITGLTMEQCLAKCLQECKCLSFQICEDDKTCQLCSSHREQSEESFKLKDGCTSYVFEREQPQFRESCVRDINCCLTAKPCQNGATCVLNNPCTSAGFSCKCRPGYQGVYCEQPIRSCRGYLDNNNGNGIYQVIDRTTNTAFPVHCNFWKRRMAWTRIQAYQLQHKYIIEESFKNDTPVNEDAPNENPFRVTFSRMNSIRQNSSKWRIERTNVQDGCAESENVNFFEQHCFSSCRAKTLKTKDDSFVLRDCYVTNHGKSGCFDEKMAGIDNFGSFCCISSPSTCSYNSTSMTKILLGDTH